VTTLYETPENLIRTVLRPQAEEPSPSVHGAEHAPGMPASDNDPPDPAAQPLINQGSTGHA
jgi:hypothetical protein